MQVQPFTLLLDFDVNRTMIFQDSVQDHSDEESLITIFADNYKVDWAGRGEEAISFKEYVNQELLPKADYYQRKKFKSTLLHWVVEKNHPAKNQVLRKYINLRTKVLDPESQKFKTGVFASVYRLMAKLRSANIHFVVKLRTFGADTEMVREEMRRHPEGINITRRGHFVSRTLHLENGTSVRRVDQIFKTFLQSKEHFAIADDHCNWCQNDYHSRGGKPFLFDSRKASGAPHLSLFFDDHFSGKVEDDIICPIDISGRKASGSTLKEKMLFRVDTLQAFEDEEYYVKLVRKAFAQNAIPLPNF